MIKSNKHLDYSLKYKIIQAIKWNYSKMTYFSSQSSTNATIFGTPELSLIGELLKKIKFAKPCATKILTKK